MEIRVDLLKLPGAETAILDGVEGIFIPKIPNLYVSLFRRKMYAFLSMSVKPSPGSKRHDYNVLHNTPPAYFDAVLADDKLGARQRLKIGTGDDGKGKRKSNGALVSMTDLEGLLDD